MPCFNLNPANWQHRIDPKDGRLKAYCTECEKPHYKGEVHEVVKKAARQIVKDEPTEHYLPLIGDAGNGD